MTRILVFGAGGVGTVYAYLLQRGGAKLTAVCRSNYAAAKSTGFTINSTKFGNVKFMPEVVRSPADATGSWDFVVVSAKAMSGSKPSQADLIKPAVGKGTGIVLMQNGIAIEEEYAEQFPENPIISCAVYLPVTQTSPAVITHVEVERLEIGTYPANAPADHKAKLETFAGLLKAGGGTVEVHEDIQVKRWSKLLMNASVNPITALSRLRDAAFLASSAEATNLLWDVMLEVCDIAQAAGYPQIDEEVARRQLGMSQARKVPGVEPSMLGDALHGRAMEVEAIIGNTLKIAEKHNVKTPLLSALYVLTKALDTSLADERTRKG